MVYVALTGKTAAYYCKVPLNVFWAQTSGQANTGLRFRV